jgi:proline dehydrogenase
MYQAAQILEKAIPQKHPHLSFCQLYGMSDNLTYNLSKAGFNISKYVPYGEVKEVIPYLIRRAKENSSVNGEMGRELGFITQEINRRRQAKK